MKLMVPLRSIEEIVPLVEAGADELYCGVKEPHAGVGYLPNAIGALSDGNFASFQALPEAVSLAGSMGVPVVFVANSSQGRHTLAWQKEDIRRAHEAGIRRVVVTDFTLIPWIKSRFPDLYIILSTLCPVFNPESLAFFARMGINRLVLDSLRTLREVSKMARLSKRLGIDLEVFTTPQTCLNIRSNCNFHTWYMSSLNRVDDSGGSPSSAAAPCHQGLPVAVYEKRRSAWACVDPEGRYRPRGFVGPNCSLCALWHLREWGVPFVKFVGRHFPLEKKLFFTRFAKGYMKGLEDGSITSKNFYRKGKEAYKRIMGCGCGAGNCFYPEILSMRDHGAGLARRASDGR